MSFKYDYPRPMVTVDIIVLNKIDNTILLIKRKNEPFANHWALPGGFVDKNEDLQHAAIRELNEETLITTEKLNQFKAYGTPNRDPRGHTISVIFYTFTNCEIFAKANDDAKELGWFKLNNLPQLAFDHQQIIKDFINS